MISFSSLHAMLTFELMLMNIDISCEQICQVASSVFIRVSMSRFL